MRSSVFNVSIYLYNVETGKPPRASGAGVNGKAEKEILLAPSDRTPSTDQLSGQSAAFRCGRFK